MSNKFAQDNVSAENNTSLQIHSEAENFFKDLGEELIVFSPCFAIHSTSCGSFQNGDKGSNFQSKQTAFLFE